jgi:acyl-CoA reductase-like NAD-dependent aldehyde dehydrogenase
MVAPLTESPSVAPPRPPPTPQTELDHAVERVKNASRAFAKLSVEKRGELARRILDGYVAIAEPSVVAACRAKGIDPASPQAGEEWLGGPMVTVRNLRLLIESLADIAMHGVPKIDPKRVRTRQDGRVVVEIFPASSTDGMLYQGFRGEAWMEKEVRGEALRDFQARHYREGRKDDRVCLVLGAGNVASIPAMDVLYKMFVEGKTCLLKMNPVNAYLGPFIEKAFAGAIEAGYLAVVYGGGEEGSYLTKHAMVDEIHITGSNHTHDAIVWGPPGADRRRRMSANDPVIKKEVTSELGNVTPVIVVPGPYSDSELAFQGANIAAQVANNASFNCNAAKIVVTPKGWDRREKLHAAIADALSKAPPRQAYYPGAEERYQRFLQKRPAVQRFGTASPGVLPWAFVRDLQAEDSTETWFTDEAFCGVLGETPLGSGDPVDFLDRAVKFANERLWGTLSATLVVHPKSLKDPAIAGAFDKAIDNLRYGTIGVNHWAGVIYGTVTLPWGGAPGSPLSDIQSGRGWVHNTYMFDQPQKSVLWGPLKMFPKPVWFTSNRKADVVGKKLLTLEASPSLGKALSVAASAIRG